MAKRRTKGDGGLIQRHDHATCPPLVVVGYDEDERPIKERDPHNCRGRWVGTLDAELPNGRKTRKYVYGRTQAEAKKKLDAARRDKADGLLVAKSPTVEKWMADYLEKRKKPPKPLKPNTWNGYESKTRTYIVPALGKRRLDQLKPRHIEALYDDMRGTGLQESTVRQTHSILAKALKEAVRKGLLSRSPMDRVDPPGTETNEREQFTIDQAARALKAAGDSARWWLALFYGMRQGEVLGMQWEYVYWGTQSFSIEKTRQNDYGFGTPILGTPKSKASRRELPMLPQIEVRLRLLWEEMGRPTSGYVFPNARGNLMDQKRDWANWRAFLDSATVVPHAPLPYIALHAARNTAASLMEASGIPDRVVMQILGQSTLKVTHRYQRAELERLREYLAAAEVVALDRAPRAIGG